MMLWTTLFLALLYIKPDFITNKYNLSFDTSTKTNQNDESTL